VFRVDAFRVEAENLASYPDGGRINAFGIEYEGKTGLSTSEFSWAA